MPGINPVMDLRSEDQGADGKSQSKHKRSLTSQVNQIGRVTFSFLYLFSLLTIVGSFYAFCLVLQPLLK